jgi:hypothetical protein
MYSFNKTEQEADAEYKHAWNICRNKASVLKTEQFQG